MKPTDFNIPKEKLQFKKSTGEIHDQKLETKPIGYEWMDGWMDGWMDRWTDG